MKKTILFLVLGLIQLLGFAQAPNISYPNPVQTYKIGEKIAVLSPINTGGTMTYDTNIVFAGSSTGETVFIPQINRPQGLTVDVLGNVYVADTDNNLIRKISPTGYISPFAGSGIAGSTNGIGTAASFNSPNGIAVDGSGNFYVTDRDNNKIRKITQAGVVSTFAGSGTAGSANGSGTVASFNNLSGIAVDVSGNVYVTESLNNKIRKITPTGVVSTFAGSGLQGSADGIGTVASFNYPSGIAVDALGNVYVADRGNYKIRKITPAGVVTTFAGSGVRGSADGTGTAASFSSPNGVAIDTSGNIYITGDDYSKIRMITSTGVVSSFYSGVFGNLPNGDSVRANSNGGIVIDARGTIYVSDSQNSQIIKTTSSDKYYTSELPAGLYINSYTGDISGTPTEISPVTTYCVTAKKLNYYGSTFCNIKIDVVSKPIISYDTPQYYDVGDIITSLSPTNAGSPVTGYTISPNLPIGLSFDTSSGIISGTPTVMASAAIYTVTASNSYGSGNFNIVIATGNFKPIISYTTPQTFTAGNTITPLWPTNSGSPATSYSINPTLPIGLSFNVSQGVISGTPLTNSAGIYLITGFNQYSSGSCSVSMSIVTIKPSISYATPQTYSVGNSITPLKPSNTGSPATSYGISPSLPTGLSLNSYTGTISGTPIAAIIATTYTVIAYNAAGSSSTTVVIATSTLGTTSFNKQELKLYPNPVNSLLHIQTPNNIILNKVTIIDLTGKKVLEQTQNTSQVNVEHLANGMYIIEAFSGEEKLVSKFVKE